MILTVPKTPPPVKSVSERFSQLDWDRVAPLRGPAIAVWPDFGFWFNYFWDEAVTVAKLTNGEKQTLVEIYAGVFEQTVGGPWQMRTDAKATDDLHRRMMLTNLLHIGFMPVTPKNRATILNGDHGDIGTEIFKQEVILKMQDDPDAVTFKIGWRCDSRGFDQIKAQNGFQARARQNEVDREWNLTRPWHPYSLAIHRDAIFIRKGKNCDNCLHTAVSVGTDLSMSVSFPKFTDPSLYTVPAGPITSTWATELTVNRKGEKARVRSDALGFYLEHDTQLYAVRISDSVWGYDTEAFQKKSGITPFPERSVNGIPLVDILARIEVTRKYWWETTVPPHWEFFDTHCQQIDIVSKSIADYVVGPPAEHVLRSFIQGQMSAVRTSPSLSFAQRHRQQLLAPPAPVVQRGADIPKPCPYCGALFKKAPLTMHVNKCPSNPDHL